MRIRGAKTELEAMGEDTDGMVESTAKLQEEIKALSGVDIMKDSNTFKSTYDILDEFADKWQNLTDIQQASITELIAGKRQGNIVSALMSNWDIAEDALNQATNNSAGSAEKELSKYQESIQYSLDQVEASFQKLSTTVINSDFFKGLVDTGNVFLKILDSIVGKVGTLGTLLGGFALFKGFSSGKPHRFHKSATGQFSREVYELQVQQGLA